MNRKGGWVGCNSLSEKRDLSNLKESLKNDVLEKKKNKKEKEREA